MGGTGGPPVPFGGSPARDAKIHGDALRYEAPAHRNALTGWTKGEDWPGWDFEVEVPGDYALEMLYGCGKGGGGSKLEVQIGGQTIAMTVEETGSFEHLVPRVVGRVKLAAGKSTLAVKVAKKAGGAVMNLRQVVLIPWVVEPPKAEAPAQQ